MSIAILAAVLVARPVASAGLANAVPAFVMWMLAALAGTVCFVGVKNAGPVARILRISPRRWAVPVVVTAVMVGCAAVAALGRGGSLAFPLEEPIARGLPVSEYAVPAVLIVIAMLAGLSYFYLLAYANDLDKRRLRATILAKERKQPGDLDKAVGMFAETWERAVRLRANETQDK